MSEPKRYPSHLRYKFVALFCFLLLMNFGWQLMRYFSLETLFFFCIGLALVIWALYAMVSYVETNANGIVLCTPLRAVRKVEFRQLISVSENGRFNPVLTLVYHPWLPNGLLDLDDAHSLILPAVRAQPELLALLEARLPT